MRVLHLSCSRILSTGQRNQLRFEVNAAPHIEGVEWTTLAIHDDAPTNDFEIRTPPIFRAVIIRYVFGWWVMIKRRGQYDIIINRHFTFDPFVMLFGWFVNNRISLHHSKEIQELRLIRKGWRGRLASSLEKWSGYINSRQVVAALGVTREIALYEKQLYKSEIPVYQYPNGIESESVKTLDDKRSPGINIAFACGRFTQWHGLDRLLDNLEAASEGSLSGVRIHVLGHVSEDIRSRITASARATEVIVLHGHKSGDDYRAVLEACDIGLGSLAMDRQGLMEGATLKVREYLALGLPVYASHYDTSLPRDFPYYSFGTVDFANIVEFASQSKRFSRGDVRSKSIPFIEKAGTMSALIHWLRCEPSLRRSI